MFLSIRIVQTLGTEIRLFLQSRCSRIVRSLGLNQSTLNLAVQASELDSS